MRHGTRGYFKERARSSRRVSHISAGLALVLLALILAPLVPFIGRARDRMVERMPIMRFGFEGPTRQVEIVRLDVTPGDGALREVGSVRPMPSRRGGGTGSAPPAARARPGPTTRAFTDEGDAEQDLVARALSGKSGARVFQSEDLIIDRLVRPVYPEDARQRGIEGRVGVLARVDTLGQVVEAALLDRSGEAQLDDAALEAVRQCRFRPYREGDEVKEVFAVFRFRFTID